MKSLSHWADMWRPLGVNTVGTIAATAVAAMLIAPRTALAALIVLALLLCVSVPRTANVGASRLVSPLIAALAIFSQYVLASTLWSVSPRSTLYVVGIGAVILLPSYFAILGMALLPPERCQKLANAILIGFIIGLLFMLVEELTDHWVKRVVFNSMPFTKRNPKHMVLRETEILNLAPYLTNRSMASASLLLWPVLGMIAFLRPGAKPWAWRGVASVALVIVAAATILRSQHETSAMAVALGAVVFAATLVRRRAGFVLVGLGWLFAVLMVVPVAHYAYDGLHLQRADWLPYSARARIVLWKYTASQVPKAPILGVGAGSTDQLDMSRTDITTVPGDPFAMRTARHAHNIYLQTWYELGAVGAALLLLIGASVLGAMARLKPQAQPYALATFATVAAMAATSWSLWQEWFMAVFALAAICCWLVERLVPVPDDLIAQPGGDAVLRSSLKSAAASQ